MKPKKRQPLDFSGIAMEPPVEDVGRQVEPQADAPVSEPDLDLDIAAVPEASPPPTLDRGPLNPEPTPIVETPRTAARRGFFASTPKERPAEAASKAEVERPLPVAPHSTDLGAEDRVTPEPELDFKVVDPIPAFAAYTPQRPKRNAQVEAEPFAPLPSFLTASAVQSPAPVVEPEAPAKRSEAAVAKPRQTPPAPRTEPTITPLSAPYDDKKPMPAPLYWSLAVAAAALWALAPIAFALGYGAGVPALKVDQFALAVFAALAIGPALLTLLGAYMLRQALAVSTELKRNRVMTDRLVTPAALASAGVTSAVEGIRAEIDAATAAAEDARARVQALREALAEETLALAQTTSESARMVKQLSDGLGHERQAMHALSTTLDAQSTAVVDAIGSQARMVAEASDLAETQLREAEAALAARAADLAAAASEASDAARVGAEDLSRQIARLETAGQGVGDQMAAVERNLAQQRAVLVAASQSLRADQEDFAGEAETRTAQLTEFIGHTRAGATEMGDMAAMGAEVLRGLIGAAADQLREVAETARAEREALAAETSSAITALASAAGGQRSDLESALNDALDAMAAAARKASEGVEQRVETARGRVDQLNEIAFAAGQKADTVFESRMDEARDLIEQSAQVVEQAGARTALKLAESVETARATIAEMESMLEDVGRRTADLPAEALARANEVRAQINHGIESLRLAARQTAEETAAIDQAFQERVRRNYDMLSEAVSRMGVAGAPQPPPASRGAAGLVRPPQAAAPLAPPVVQPVNEPSADEIGLRPRLRLTPTASDDEFRSIFDAAGGRNAAPPPAQPTEQAEPPGGWSWRNMLSGLESAAPGDAALGEKMAAEILAMGIDPTALLPRGRIDEIAATIQTHDSEGAREVVKKLAPAAIRRLVRRLFSDAALRADADRFLRRYSGMMDEAADQDREGFLVAALLSSDAGRAYLLLDAASGDLA
ncbi:polar localization protein TipN [Caulobacter sp. DWP3-1-3b2]|uniref:polar localization protein TipN n=1 Tax=Caulobacter sp. DWP3-1-3b2 TaxID=2804643 RepID=UPI003CEF715F